MRQQAALLLLACFVAAYVHHQNVQDSLGEIRAQQTRLAAVQATALAKHAEDAKQARAAATPSPTPKPPPKSTDETIERASLPLLVDRATASYFPLVLGKLSRRELIKTIKEKVFVHAIYMFFKWAPRGTSVWDDDLQRCLDAPEERAISQIFKRLLGEGKCKDEKKVVFDIGGNSGFFSVMAAKFGCNVYTFDPMPSCCKQIAENLIVNNLTEKVTIFNNFVLDSAPGAFSQGVHVDEPCFQMFEAGGEKHSKKFKKESDSPIIPVAGIRLDDMMLKPGTKISVMKVDVEGGDQKLLAGSLEFLKRNNVEDLIVEYGRGDEAAAAAMLGKLRDLGYVHQYVVGVEKWLTDEHRSKFPVESLCANGHVGDIACDAIEVPKEQAQLFVHMVQNCWKCRKPGTKTPRGISANVWFRKKPLKDLPTLSTSG